MVNGKVVGDLQARSLGFEPLNDELLMWCCYVYRHCPSALFNLTQCTLHTFVNVYKH